MRLRSWLYAILVAVLIAAPVALLGRGSPATTPDTTADEQMGAAGAPRGGQDEFGDYIPSGPWQEWPSDADHAKWTFASVAAVFAETPDRIWIAQRGEIPLPEKEKPGTTCADMRPPQRCGGGLKGTRWHHTIRVVDRNGKTIQYWAHLDAMFDKPGGRGPHAIKISPYDPEKKVWVVDDNMHMIYRYTYDGKLDRSWGEIGVPGRDGNHFNRPTDVTFLPNGDFLIADGYVGNRVAKFNKDGEFLMDWGQKAVDESNPKAGEFNSVHGIAVKGDRIYIADREHGRIQVYDFNGKFLDMWDVSTKPIRTRGTMYVLASDAEDAIWASDLDTGRFIKYDLKGNYQYSWGSLGTHTGATLCQHAMTVDQIGTLYVADCTSARLNKYVPKPGANPKKLIGMEKKGASWWKPS